MEAYKLAVSRMALDHKLPQGDPLWSTLNSSFENVQLPAGRILRAVYEGHAITTQHKDNWRHSRNYLCGQHLGLDIDTEDKSATLPVLMQDKFISKYAAFIHTTISHREEAPRSRVIFLLDTPIMQPKNYALAAQSLLWLFGSADRACHDPVRFFYGAPGCQSEYLDNVLPLEVVKKLIAQYAETGRVEKKRADRNDYHVPPTQQEVADALAKIPAWGIEYDEWVQVLMGIHAEFGEAGYQLAENWAQGAQGEVSRKWKSFKPDGNTSGSISVATVFGIAKRFGWQKAVTV